MCIHIEIQAGNSCEKYKGVGLIPARGSIVDHEDFSTVPGLNFNICMIST